MSREQHYTFGDNDVAAARLGLLAEAFDPSSRAWLASLSFPPSTLVADLGCGPGRTTALLRDRFTQERIVGLDRSESFIAEARRSARVGTEFQVHDVTKTPFPLPPVDILYCRFLLTHLTERARVLGVWREATAPHGHLLLDEDTELASEHPSFARYYELVQALQAHYGQDMYVGRHLDELVGESPWRIEHRLTEHLELPASTMARLHMLNLRTWSRDPYAKSAFDAAELETLRTTFERITDGEEAPPVTCGMVRAVLVGRDS